MQLLLASLLCHFLLAISQSYTEIRTGTEYCYLSGLIGNKAEVEFSSDYKNNCLKQSKNSAVILREGASVCYWDGRLEQGEGAVLRVHHGTTPNMPPFMLVLDATIRQAPNSSLSFWFNGSDAARWQVLLVGATEVRGNATVELRGRGGAMGNYLGRGNGRLVLQNGASLVLTYEVTLRNSFTTRGVVNIDGGSLELLNSSWLDVNADLKIEKGAVLRITFPLQKGNCYVDEPTTIRVGQKITLAKHGEKFNGIHCRND